MLVLAGEGNVATLAEVAKRAGVSLATASRAINGGGRRPVDPQLVAQVMTAARELNYVPNAHAQALARSESTTVGVIVHDVSDPYFTEIVRGLQRAAVEAGRLVTICNSYRQPDRELEYLSLLRSQQVGAIIMTGGGLDDLAYSQQLAAQVHAFADAGGRTIFIGRHHVAGDAVLPDNAGGARALGEAVLELGHRKIGVIAGPELLTTTRDRIEGLRQAFATRGVAFDDAAIVWGDFSRESGATAAATSAKRDLTAIIALNDAMAIGALSTLRELHIPVPDQISLFGFDDIPIARDVTPALSTVYLPLAEMGARAIELALEPRASELRVEHFPAKVVLRASSRRL